MNEDLKCSFCGNDATWMLMSGRDNACDECLPRKCSCTMEPKDGDWESMDRENWEYRKDVDGRYLPCCEWEEIK